MTARDPSPDGLAVEPGAEGRLDQWLAVQRPELSRSRWQKVIRAGGVRVDGAVAAPRARVVPGQVVSIDPGLVAPMAPADPGPPAPEALALAILHEDASLLAIDKAPGMVVHPGNGCSRGTVVQAALHHCGSLPDLGDPERPGVVHRIDRETSGALLLAKTVEAGRELQRQFREREVEKAYWAVVQGCPEADAGTIDRAIGRHPVARTRMAEVPAGRPALTHWEVLHRSPENWSVLRLRIETGRTHQIRVHLSARGHPLLGDRLYGYRPSRSRGLGAAAQRVMLHARSIRFRHPESGEDLLVEAPVPPDLGEYLPPP